MKIKRAVRKICLFSFAFILAFSVSVVRFDLKNIELASGKKPLFASLDIDIYVPRVFAQRVAGESKNNTNETGLLKKSFMSFFGFIDSIVMKAIGTTTTKAENVTVKTKNKASAVESAPVYKYTEPKETVLPKVEAKTNPVIAQVVPNTNTYITDPSTFSPSVETPDMDGTVWPQTENIGALAPVAIPFENPTPQGFDPSSLLGTFVSKQEFDMTLAGMTDFLVKQREGSTDAFNRSFRSTLRQAAVDTATVTETLTTLGAGLTSLTGTVTTLATTVAGLGDVGGLSTTTLNSLNPIQVGNGNTASGSCSSAFGYCNIASTTASVAVGLCNIASALGASAVGVINTSSGCLSSASGYRNTASGCLSSASGYRNTASGSRTSSFGHFNSVTADFSSASGYRNTVNACYASAVGQCNTASADLSTAFGYRNTSSGNFSSAVGFFNTASGCYSTAVGTWNSSTALNSIAVGRSNFTGTGGLASVQVGILNNSTGGTLNTSTGAITGTISACDSVGALSSAFGICNKTEGGFSSAMGYENYASAVYSSAVGSFNCSNGFSSFALGISNVVEGSGASGFGNTNAVTGTFTSASGSYNTAAGDQAIISGIFSCTSADHSSVFGNRNHSSALYSSAVGSCLTNDRACTTRIGYENSWASVGLNTGSKLIDTSSGAHLTTGGSWTNSSSKEKKENYTPLDKEEMLAKIRQLNIERWNYKTEDPNNTHIGPYAEDFYELFNTGNDSKAISTIDSAGVALIGVQAIAEKMDKLVEKVVDGVAYIGNLVVENFHAYEITIGNPDKPEVSGITIYDRATGEPVCMYVRNGDVRTSDGPCGDEEEDDDNEESGSNSENSSNDNEDQNQNGEEPDDINTDGDESDQTTDETTTNDGEEGEDNSNSETNTDTDTTTDEVNTDSGSGEEVVPGEDAENGDTSNGSETGEDSGEGDPGENEDERDETPSNGEDSAGSPPEGDTQGE